MAGRDLHPHLRLVGRGPIGTSRHIRLFGALNASIAYLLPRDGELHWSNSLDT
jgi:hypothetical protein